jgi:hypothetical protein
MLITNKNTKKLLPVKKTVKLKGRINYRKLMREIVRILRCFHIRHLSYLKSEKLLTPLRNSLTIFSLKIKIINKLKSIRNNKLAFKKKIV